MTAPFDKYSAARERTGAVLCVGLDTDLDKIPEYLRDRLQNLLFFNLSIIEATKDIACAYKLNFAFYEKYGLEGWEILKKTFDHIPTNVLKIADAKRGDIGNTSKAYADSVKDYFGADAVTVNPYMGSDCVEPFLNRKDLFVFLLGLTSNQGSSDFQKLDCEGEPLYKKVIKKSCDYAPAENLGFVVGATHPKELAEVRSLAPDRLFLIPGVGAQGGDPEAVLQASGAGPAIVNVSRSVIYAGDDMKFADKAREKALEYQKSLKF